MKTLLMLASLALLTACGSGGPPPPDWKNDAADLIERYQKHALLGENTLAERYFQQAVAATGGAGRVAETARLWLVRCATRRAMLIDDACAEYAELAGSAPNAADLAYYRFLTLHWEALDVALLPGQHRAVQLRDPALLVPFLPPQREPVPGAVLPALHREEQRESDDARDQLGPSDFHNE